MHVVYRQSVSIAAASYNANPVWQVFAFDFILQRQGTHMFLLQNNVVWDSTVPIKDSKKGNTPKSLQDQ